VRREEEEAASEWIAESGRSSHSVGIDIIKLQVTVTGIYIIIKRRVSSSRKDKKDLTGARCGSRHIDAELFVKSEQK
jgi:hypothetical protein